MYILTVIAFTISVAIIHIRKAKKNKSMQLDGLVNIANVKSLIGLVQKHRGLSSAKLNGDMAKTAELATIERSIRHVINDLTNTKVATNSRWLSFYDHWTRLTNLTSDIDPDNNFKQHTKMISNLLYILEDEAESSHLNSLSIPSMPNIGYVWRELVVSTEIIGQSRAIGTGVATVGNCSSVDKIRLSFLEQHITKTCKVTLSKLPFLDNYSVQHQELLSVAQKQMASLINTIEYELIQKESVAISANDYFNLATNTITAIDHIFNNQLEQIKNTL
jgi:hypothetical protein